MPLQLIAIAWLVYQCEAWLEASVAVFDRLARYIAA